MRGIFCRRAGPVQVQIRNPSILYLFSAKVGGSGTEGREAIWERSTPKDIGRIQYSKYLSLHFLVMRRICFDMTVLSDIPIRADSGAGKVG